MVINVGFSADVCDITNQQMQDPHTLQGKNFFILSYIQCWVSYSKKVINY